MSDRIHYGPWIEKKSPGVFKLTMQGTVGLVAGFLIVIFAAGRFNNLFVTIGLIVALVVFEVLFGWEYDGKTLARRRGERRDTTRRDRTGETSYVAGVMASLEGSQGGNPLPGVLAETTLLRGVDGYGNLFDVLHYPSRGLFAAVFRTYPDGAGTTDQETIDYLVAKLGGWMSTLPTDDGSGGGQIVIDSAIGSGVQLRESVETARAATSPPAASRIMDQVVRDLPDRSAEITGYATVVWRRSAMPATVHTPEDVVVEIAKQLPNHQAALAAGGAGDPTAMTEPEFVETARVAYDPGTAELFDVLRARDQQVELGWADAGPSFGFETRTEFRHDGGSSFTLEMRTPPKGLVLDSILNRLLMVNPVFLRKRVAIFYQAVGAEKAQSIAENAVRTEDFQAGQQKGRRTAATRREDSSDEQLEQHIAAGATVVPFAILATATHEDTPEAQAAATTALKSLMVASRMRVRQSKGLQAALFHMSLPLGILPWEFADNPFKR